METRSIYVTVRIDVNVPNGSNVTDYDIVANLAHVDATVESGSNLSIENCEICDINN